MDNLAPVKVTSSEKEFIEYLIGFIVKTNPGDLNTNLEQVTKDLQDNYDPKHNLNLHRKQYGNLKSCVQLEATKMVFEIFGSAFRFLHPNKVVEANQRGLLTP